MALCSAIEGLPLPTLPLPLPLATPGLVADPRACPPGTLPTDPYDGPPTAIPPGSVTTPSMPVESVTPPDCSRGAYTVPDGILVVLSLDNTAVLRPANDAACCCCGGRSTTEEIPRSEDNTSTSFTTNCVRDFGNITVKRNCHNCHNSRAWMTPETRIAHCKAVNLVASSRAAKLNGVTFVSSLSLQHTGRSLFRTCMCAIPIPAGAKQVKH